LFAIIGATVGSYVPILFGAGFLSMWSLFMGGVGGLLGTWIAYKVLT
jgi:hypothetical protein